jgi:hypothetical protein
MLGAQAFDFLMSLDIPSFTMIDVGCHKGHFRDTIQAHIKHPMFWVGIDPMVYPETSGYDVFVSKAVDLVEDSKTQTFYEYVEPGCNSLSPMLVENITHDRAQTNKWFVGWKIEELLKTRTVTVTSLQNILTQIGLPSKDLHFVKIDTQGTDIRVAKSLGRYLQSTYYIQLECAATTGVTLYEGQQIVEQDIADMKMLGFEILTFVKHADIGNSPEADVIFFNTNLIPEGRHEALSYG